MKIGRLHIYWEREYESVRRYEKRLSKLDDQRLNKYISGGYHIHKNPKSKGNRNQAGVIVEGVLLQNTDPPKIEEKRNDTLKLL